MNFKLILKYTYSLVLPSLYFKEDISSKVLLLNVVLFLLFLLVSKEDKCVERPKIKPIITSYNFVILSLLTVIVLISTLCDGAWYNAEIRFLFAALGLYFMCYMFFHYQLVHFKILVLVNAVFSILMGTYVLLLKYQGQDIVLIFQGHVFNSMLMAGNILLAFFYLLAKKEKNQVVKSVLLFSVVVSFIAILSIGGRMSFSALVICLLLYFSFFMGLKKSIYLSLVLGFVVSLMLFFNDSIYLRIEDFFKWDGHNPLFLRVVQWKCYFDTFLEKPIFGSGHVSTLASVMECYIDIGYRDGIESSYHSHNQFVEIATKYGVVGFLLFLGFFVYNLITSVKSKDYSFMILILFLLLINITENVFLSRHVGNIFFSFVLFNMYFREKIQLLNK